MVWGRPVVHDRRQSVVDGKGRGAASRGSTNSVERARRWEVERQTPQTQAVAGRGPTRVGESQLEPAADCDDLVEGLG